MKKLTTDELFAYAIGNSLINGNDSSELKYYENDPQELQKIVHPHIARDHINTVIKSCEEGRDGNWDCTTEEGKQGFDDMIELLEDVRELLWLPLPK